MSSLLERDRTDGDPTTVDGHDVLDVRPAVTDQELRREGVVRMRRHDLGQAAVVDSDTDQSDGAGPQPAR